MLKKFRNNLKTKELSVLLSHSKEVVIAEVGTRESEEKDDKRE
jgi:hypothetical protein